MAPLFPLGRVLATPGAIALMEAARIDPAQLLERHQSGDWGDLEEEDWRENDFDVSHQGVVSPAACCSSPTSEIAVSPCCRRVPTTQEFLDSQGIVFCAQRVIQKQ